MLELVVYSLVVRGQGQDLLMGTNVHNYVKIPGLEHLLHKFIAELDHAFEYIYKNDVKGFLNQIETRYALDLQRLQENMVENITQMQEIQSDTIMIYYLVITKTLESLRNTVFQTKGIEWIKKKYISKKKKAPPLKWWERLEYEGSYSSEDYSLLYNLIFIHFLAEIYEDSKVKETAKKQIEQKIDNIIKNLVYLDYTS